MKRTSLLATIVGFAAIAALPPDASAYYHAQVGRFINRDPIGYGDGANAYRYARGAPTRFTDPSGLWSQDGVLLILCRTPIGRSAVSALNRNGGKIYMTDYVRSYKATRTAATAEWSPWEHKYWAGLQSAGKIYILSSKSDASAASTFVHEVEHLQQHSGEHGGARKRGERFAYARATLFALESPVVAPRPGFVTVNANGSPEVDYEAIRRYVDTAYEGFYEQSEEVKYKNDGSGKRIYEFGNLTREGGWDCDKCLFPDARHPRVRSG